MLKLISAILDPTTPSLALRGALPCWSNIMCDIAQSDRFTAQPIDPNPYQRVPRQAPPPDADIIQQGRIDNA